MGAYQFSQAPTREAADGPARLTPAADRAGNPGLFYFFENAFLFRLFCKL
jgi:hypothetical protein